MGKVSPFYKVLLLSLLAKLKIVAVYYPFFPCRVQLISFKSEPTSKWRILIIDVFWAEWNGIFYLFTPLLLNQKEAYLSFPIDKMEEIVHWLQPLLIMGKDWITPSETCSACTKFQSDVASFSMLTFISITSYADTKLSLIVWSCCTLFYSSRFVFNCY